MADGGQRPLDASTVRRFEALALPHADAAFNLAFRLTRHSEAAEDIVHDAYLRALQGLDQFRGGDPRAWILRIVRNRAFDWLRERKLKQTAPLGGADPDDPDWDFHDPDQVTPEEALVREGEAAGVRAVLDALPPRLREVLVLREMEDLSYREIAEITQAPIGTVMSRLARARALAAERLQADRGGLR
jgi:RNA polymerase sigma-70 factor (ECF subfamily)